MINVAHSACLIFGGTFDPAYTLTITALPSQIQPTLNKRNAAIIQTFMAEGLGVAASRGVVKFVAIAEENFATNGQTILGELEALDKHPQDEGSSRKSSVARNKGESRKSSHAGIPMHAEPNKKSYVGVPVQSQPLIEKSKTRPNKTDPAMPPMPPMPKMSALDREAAKTQKLGRRKSFLAMFGK